MCSEAERGVHYHLTTRSPWNGRQMNEIRPRHKRIRRSAAPNRITETEFGALNREFAIGKLYHTDKFPNYPTLAVSIRFTDLGFHPRPPSSLSQRFRRNYLRHFIRRNFVHFAKPLGRITVLAYKVMKWPIRWFGSEKGSKRLLADPRRTHF